MQENLLLNEGYNLKEYANNSNGTHIFINKKKYIDLASCAGSQILGHNNIEIKKIQNDIIKKGISNYAMPNIHAVNFSNTLNRILKNFSKYIFCNSGSEAIIKGLRISRALSKNKIIINATGSWHGSVNETLYFSKNNSVEKLSDGLPNDTKKNIKFIPYGDVDVSRKILDKYKKKINCVLLEPVQGSLPTDENIHYVKFLERYCKQNKILFFLDEMITGLRTHRTSFQNYYKIRSDISVFGKSFGGGFPIGIIGISKSIENKIKKKKIKIFFGGTFSGNSTIMCIANKITNIINKKKKIISNIDKKAELFKNSINKFAIQNNLDVKVFGFTSMVRIVFSKNKIINRTQRDFFETKNKTKIEKFKKYLSKNRIYYPKNGIIFFSYSMSNEDLNKVIKIIKQGLILCLK